MKVTPVFCSFLAVHNLQQMHNKVHNYINVRVSKCHARIVSVKEGIETREIFDQLVKL